jgi:DNA-binding CsgD family transcriptional regulator
MKARLVAAGLGHGAASHGAGPPGPDAGGEPEPASARVAAARSRARERGDAQRQALRPRGYLTKDASAEQIEAAIRAVHAGQTHLDPAVQERLVAAVISRPAAPAPNAASPGSHEPLPDGLTTREAEVLTLLASGLSNAEIAQRLYLSHATVKTHINRIFAKTGARDRAQAVRYAYQHGLTSTELPGNLPRFACQAVSSGRWWRCVLLIVRVIA